jgi:hypothetical protein
MIKSKLFLVATAVAGVLAASHVSAATLVGTTSDATGIDGLVVDGVTYDVTFVHASYDTVYASTPPTFIGNQSGAFDAASALATALNALGVQYLAGLSTPLEWATVPYELLTGVTAYACFDPSNSFCFGTPWVPEIYGEGTGGNSFTFYYIDYTVFTSSATPLPAALPLFATGLGGLGLLGWRRKRKAQAV